MTLKLHEPRYLLIYVLSGCPVGAGLRVDRGAGAVLRSNCFRLDFGLGTWDIGIVSVIYLVTGIKISTLLPAVNDG